MTDGRGWQGVYQNALMGGMDFSHQEEMAK